MNDRYLFRAKRIDNGEWAIGNLVYSEDADKEFKAIMLNDTPFLVGRSTITDKLPPALVGSSGKDMQINS